MLRNSALRLLCLIVVLLVASTLVEARDKKDADRKDRKKETALLAREAQGRVEGILELSGATADSDGKTLFVVGDKGQVAQVDLSGKVLRQKFLGDRDFEAIALLSASGRLLLLDEGTRTLVWIAAADFSVVAQRALSPGDLGISRTVDIDQFEALAVRPLNARQSLAYLAFHCKGEHFSRIESVILEDLRLVGPGPERWRVSKVVDIADIALSRDSRVLYLLDDRDDRILRFEAGKKTGVVSRIPGVQQESLALVPGGLRVFAENGDFIDYPVLP